MRILIVHSTYRSGAASGENRVVQDEVRLLRESGHDVRPLDPEVPLGARGALLATRRSFSGASAFEVGSVVSAEGIDVVHIHNLFPMFSPGVLGAAKVAGATVLMTLHNYRLGCLPATLLRDGHNCEACIGKIPWRGVVYGCYRNSRAASAVLASSLSLHRRRGSLEHVARFLAVSSFVREKHIEMGLPEERITVKPNFAWPALLRDGAGDYFLYLGRLSPEKGLATLMKVWANVAYPLLVVGDGPQLADLRAAAPKHVEFRGAVTPEDVPGLITRARALLVPSEWYETFGKVIPEAYASGVPVIASGIGGVPEVVEEGVTGRLALPGDLESWRIAVEALLDDSESERLGEAAYRRWKQLYSPEPALKALEKEYGEAVLTS